VSGRVAAQASPPLAIVAPFFFVAPVFLVAAGVILLGISGADLGAYNHPYVLAFVHTLVLGWVTLIMFGATYQLGAAVLRAPVPSSGLLRTQLVAHVVGVAALVFAFREWRVDWLEWVPALVLFSVGAHIWIAQRMFRPSVEWSPTRIYLFASNVALIATVLIGALWARMLDGGAVTLTASRVAAHAHVGLVGWLALTLMGIHYQLLPMFMLVPSKPPRFARYALGFVSSGLLLFFVAGLFQWGATSWMAGVILMAGGSALWFADQMTALRHRRRRRPDLYFAATVISLAFFVATVGLGLATAATFAADGFTINSTRLLFAYFISGVVGWMGTALVANSYKIVPFLVWYHRYSGQAGAGSVPLLSDMFSLRWAKLVVTVHVSATLALVLAVATRETALVTIAAAGLIAAGLAHTTGLLTMLLPKTSSRPKPAPRRSVTQND
jgi:hypothetical protein